MNITQPPTLPFLEFLGWQIVNVYRLTQLEMLATYERGWRYRHITDLPDSELAFIKGSIPLFKVLKEKNNLDR